MSAVHVNGMDTVSSQTGLNPLFGIAVVRYVRGPVLKSGVCRDTSTSGSMSPSLMISRPFSSRFRGICWAEMIYFRVSDERKAMQYTRTVISKMCSVFFANSSLSFTRSASGFNKYPARRLRKNIDWFMIFPKSTNLSESHFFKEN
jgi:hypothetical protein